MLLDLDTNIDNKRAGYRLQRLEVLNWGTFDEHVWNICPNGDNALLTGDIGSGKSTLVDALTSLLVPHQKITYNKAAGADTRERSLLSYIRGAFKNEKVNQSSKARDVYLRTGKEHFTVVLAVFSNEGFGQSATLAQVFWLQNDGVKKFYILAQNEMSIVKDFSDFGTQITRLKKSLRQRKHTEVFDTFSHYANRFRQTFGIRQPEALDLFYQTVSMKSVGNLTDFVRDQMLGQTDIQNKIDELVSRYGDLTEAHRAVQRAKEQSELLLPLVEEANQLENTRLEIESLEAVLDEIPRYFARHQVKALQQQLQDLYHNWQENEEVLIELSTTLNQHRQDLGRLETARAGLSINQQLQSIRMELEQRLAEKNQRQQQAQAYQESCDRLIKSYPKTEVPKINIPASAEQFLQQRQWASTTLDDIFAEMEHIRDQLQPLYVQSARHRDQVEELETELHSLRKRPTQIPQRNIELRARILESLQLTAHELPFAGELLQVREAEKDWQGAIERQLHNLGLSILVPDRHYRVVSDYVDRHHLGGKLVYLRTLEHRHPTQEEPGINSLAHKILIKGDTEFYDWLERELHNRYDYTCCENMEDFRRAARAITRTGQSKSGRISHTKDDRYDVNDRRRYILGWSNQEKISALENELKSESEALAKAERDHTAFRQRENQLSDRRDELNKILQFTTFEAINFRPQVLRIQELQEEQQRLETGSEELRELQSRIQTLKTKIEETELQKTRRNQQSGSLRSAHLRNAQQIYELLEILETELPPVIGLTDDGFPADITQLKEQFTQVLISEEPPSKTLQEYLLKISMSGGSDELEKTKQKLQEQIGGNRGVLKRSNDQASKLERSISLHMKEFKNRYPEEALEFDADPRSIPEFRDLHTRLQQDDIPRHEERFRELLKQGTIRSILTFKSKLEEYEQDIVEKIERINTHLHEIDYNPGTYIRIAREEVRSEDILTFKQDLRACLSDVYGDTDNIYTEEKFYQVKKLLDRFRGDTEDDSRWTRRVTDVRQWYTFGAEERWRETNEPHEYFSDSSGKSGGQKEKLAYTILASAIAFQFGLEWGRSRDRSFRFVVIDEAFGRGSDESTRYALQLFERLSLQLLIVTPLQKINVIEDYINAVHYVSNPSGQQSLVRNISKAEYLLEKAERLAQQNGNQ
ncbi:MAG: ATP-binding protein [Saprospiraceae bacterium]|nr:MAG: ATP-binding protein [Saprospiraceae bacterium]